MSNCRWYEIDGFASSYDVANFEAYLARQIAEGHAEEVPATAGEAGTRGKYFRWKETGAIWRLVPPEGSMRGHWQPV